ncbi:hypothetical protein L1987_12810 [Smallanthus sonchifolius]|uniref:Uncharacterized protein n=1 Tax=Smallanthus sonchifolius TaxID=185202 RepID=A0ACB9JH54_9ASTR|nr:hypothetical protein L1987_12810 [Smallanthus sonchifolius]
MLMNCFVFAVATCSKQYQNTLSLNASSFLHPQSHPIPYNLLPLTDPNTLANVNSYVASVVEGVNANVNDEGVNVNECVNVDEGVNVNAYECVNVDEGVNVDKGMNVDETGNQDVNKVLESKQDVDDVHEVENEVK